MTSDSNLNKLGINGAWQYIVTHVVPHMHQASYIKDDDREYISSSFFSLAKALQHFTPTSNGLHETSKISDFIANAPNNLTEDQITRFCSQEKIDSAAFSAAAGIHFLNASSSAENEEQKNSLQKKGFFFLTELARAPKQDRLLMALQLEDPWSASLKVDKVDSPLIPEFHLNLDNTEIQASNDASSVRGRIAAIRVHGKTSFIDIINQNGQQQAALAKTSENKNIHLTPGDLIDARGQWGISRTGMRTFFIDEITGYIPAPDRIAEKLSQDWMVASARGRIISRLRSGLTAQGYLEVQTPTLTKSFEGGSSRPFRTLENGSGETRYLRVTSELELLKMIAGGAEKVFEIAPSFRNEKIGAGQSREFHMMEAYSTRDSLVDFSRDACTLVSEIMGIETPFTQKPLAELAREKLSLDIHDEQAVRDFVSGNIPELDIDRHDHAGIVHNIYNRILVDHIQEPTLVSAIPGDGSPLIRGSGEDAHRLWMCVNGMEIAEIAENETVATTMAGRLTSQFQKDKSLVDRDYRGFIQALSAGVPHVVGIGLGVERFAEAARLEHEKKRERNKKTLPQPLPARAPKTPGT